MAKIAAGKTAPKKPMPKGAADEQTTGAALLGLNEDGKLRYAGKAGTGYTADEIDKLTGADRPARGQGADGPNPARGGAQRPLDPAEARRRDRVHGGDRRRRAAQLREFKLEAVKLIQERGVSVSQAARDLDLHENVLRKWVREQAADPGWAFPGHGVMKPEQQEIERLRRDLARMKAERDILKKAAAYFARESI